MSIATNDDLSLILSGGSTNINPNLSIGGNPTVIRIVNNVMNNLFSDITPAEASAGKEDYRCLYFFNDAVGENSTIYNVQLITTDQVEGGSTVLLGIAEQNESQRITLTSANLVTPAPPTSGSFDISFMGFPFTTNYNSDLASWALDIQNKLLGLQDNNSNNLISSVSVTAQLAINFTIVFDITFTGVDGKRNVETLEVGNNTLDPLTDITVSTLQEGSPVNTIAPLLDVDTTPPSGVVFFDPTVDDPILIPRLESGDGFPVWFKRTTPAGSEALPADDISILFRSTVLP